MAVAAFACGCADSQAPERRCTSHTQCDDGFMCGPESQCIPSVACGGDADCCPGAVCFSGWCRPTSECDPASPSACPGLGEVCEATGYSAPIPGNPGESGAGALGGSVAPFGICAPSPCDTLGGCAEPFTCVAGRCLLGPPCGGCAAGTACELRSGRCLPAPAGCECEAGWAVASVGTSPLSCGSDMRCTCANLPEVPPGQPGVDGRLVASAGGAPLLVSYEPVYGDLVASRFDGARSDTALDGVPVVTARAGGAYRGGVLDPGPDRGARPAAVARGAGLDVVYRDLDLPRVMHLGWDGGSAVTSSALPIEGRDVGRYACLFRGADGRLSGLVFVASDSSDSVALLVRVESRVAEPRAADDWSATTVVETRLPLRSESPCAGACGLGEVCVVEGGQEVCERTLDLSGVGAACGPCGVHEVCGEVAGVRACRPRVYARSEVDRLPFGEGLFASCIAGEPPLAAWYDADTRRLVAGRWPLSASDRQVVDSGLGRDPGRSASIARSPAGRVAIAYQDAALGVLRVASATAWGAPWTYEDLAPPEGTATGHGVHATFVGERLVVVEADVRGQVWVFARGVSGCWGSAAAFGEGAYAYPDVLADTASGGVWVTAQALQFSPSLAPLHHPEIVAVALPACAN